MVPGIANHGAQENFILDTGCTYNVVSEDFARRHSIRSFADSIEVQGITEDASCRIGFIDSITIEDLTYQNVLVLILPSLVPMSRHLGYTIDAILGIPFLKAIGTVELYPKKGRMVFPIVDERAKPNPQSNLSVLEYMRVEMAVGPVKRTLAVLDTGHDCFMMGKSLYDSYSKDFQQYDFQKKNLRIVGVTGEIDTIPVWVPEKPVPIKTGAAEIKYKDVLVTESTNIGQCELLGKGVLNSFRKVTIDLKSMTLSTR